MCSGSSEFRQHWVSGGGLLREGEKEDQSVGEYFSHCHGIPDLWRRWLVDRISESTGLNCRHM